VFALFSQPPRRYRSYRIPRSCFCQRRRRLVRLFAPGMSSDRVLLGDRPIKAVFTSGRPSRRSVSSFDSDPRNVSKSPFLVFSSVEDVEQI
ncbi:unnamed protein product, partial [Nesidiocoris tenuis]